MPKNVNLNSFKIVVIALFVLAVLLDNDDFGEYAIYGGYGKTSGASLSHNCHGYSTHMNYWLNDFGTKITYDYTPETIAEHLGEENKPSIVVFAANGHSVLAETAVRKAAGEMEYEIDRTREKFNASAIYTKEINLTYFDKSGNITLDITSGMNLTTGYSSATVGFYYYPKK